MFDVVVKMDYVNVFLKFFDYVIACVWRRCFLVKTLASFAEVFGRKKENDC